MFSKLTEGEINVITNIYNNYIKMILF